MILIASAAYVNSEFQTEFGRLPPALLPVGNRRLFEHQLKVLYKHFPDEDIFLSLPKSYLLTENDKTYLTKKRIHVLRSDETLSLAESIAIAMSAAQSEDNKLRLLHGDTLLSTLPADLDVIGITETDEDYLWEVEKTETAGESVWCGYFAFQHANEFLKALLLSEGSFTRAVRLYDLVRPMNRILLNGWLDFGHVNTYFRSRAQITTERAFNTLNVIKGCVKKTGQPSAKIYAESQWFANLPSKLKPYCPQLIDHGFDRKEQPYYVLEYLPLPPLNEVFVHGKNPVFYWDKIFRLCSEFLQDCRAYVLDNDEKLEIEQEAAKLISQKSWQRLEEFTVQSGYPGLEVAQHINGVNLPSIREIVQDCLNRLEKVAPQTGVLHGDFCLSNILFDSRGDCIKVIDPRGLNASGRCSILGDLRYDLAKLTHSIIGLYDHILAGAFEVGFEYRQNACFMSLNIYIDERVEAIQKVFLSRDFIGGLKPLNILPLTVLLFFSMLPLHADDKVRQLALLANALRLYVLMKSN